MTLYTVNAPPGAADPDPGSLVFVKEGFSWPALFIPEIWLIVKRQWLVLLLYVAGAVALGALAELMNGGLPILIVVLARFYFALEANGLRRWTLERNGYGLIGVAEGRGLEEAELRFFSEWSGAASAPATPAPPPQGRTAMPVAPPPAWTPTAENGGVVGLFPKPGSSP